MRNLSDITNTTTHSQTFINKRYQALKHTETIILTQSVWIIAIDIIIVHVLLNVEECDCSVDVDEDQNQQPC